MKLIGKGHRHKTTQEKVRLREVVEVAKTFEATTFANQLMKTARNTQQEQVNYTTKSPQLSQCFWCGGKHQQPRQQHCPAIGKKCAKCGIIGHFARVCRGGTRRQARQHQSNFISEDTNEEAFVTECDTTPQFARKYFANLHLIHGEKTKVVKAQIDSASTCNTISSSLLRKLFPNAEIRRTRSKINTYGSETMRPEGQVTLCCERRGRIHTIDFLVVNVPDGKPALLSGRDAQALNYLRVYADETANALEEEIPRNPQPTPPLGKLTKNDVLQCYADVFRPGRGSPLGTPMHIELDPNVRPVHAQVRRVPVAKLGRVNEELERLSNEGIITPVTQPTDWLSNILVKEKPNGKLRICIDPSQTINKAIRRPKYTIPTIEEKLPLLTNAKVFTIVDVSEAFHTIELDEESSLLTTFQGPSGRYCFTRMPFGIASGPEEYQRRQHEFLDGLQGVINIADDICVFGCGDSKEEADLDHDKNLTSLLEKCSKQDLRLSSVTFMGHKLTDKGVEPDPAKVDAITKMPTPTDKSGVQRFLGMCQYLSKFCHNLSETVLPLRDLTKENSTFLWSNNHENAFNSAKNLIASATALRYYDPALPVTLQVDASEDAIGGVLLQDDQPVCFTSHRLNNTEKNYVQIEKECLAIVSCMDKWHQYLYGKHDITVHTDHQPLETIFKKPLSKAPRRLQRMMLKLQRYQFSVRYKKGKELYVADTLSRAPVADQPSAPDAKQGYEVFRLEIAEMDIEPNRITSETMQQIKQETTKDSVLVSLCDVVASGWPAERKETPEHLRQYWSFRDEISVYDGVAYRSHQVIVPSSLREEMLQKIHKAHQGVDSSIRRARESLFWPGMQAAIKEKCLSCGLCARYVSERPQEPMKSHTIPDRPWSKISADLFQLDGNNYLVMVDHYSDYIELDSLNTNTSANTVIRAMKRQFARHGIPDELLTDNGPQFESHEYSRFAREYGFTIVKSSPYYSRGNGKAESAVKIAKNILKKSRKDDPYLALLAYRNTPQQGYNYSPAQRLMSRRLKDIIPTAHQQLTPQTASPSLVHDDIAERRRRSMAQYNKRASQPLREFSKGEKVFVKPRPGNKHQPWIYGEVIGSTAPRSCTVNTSAGPVRRNHTQIREAKVEPEDKLEDRLETVSLPESELAETDQPVEREPTPQTEPEPVSTLRRSMRQRRPPTRFKDFVMD